MKAYRIACGCLLLLIACGPMAEPTGGDGDRRYLIAMNSGRIDTRAAPDTPVLAGDGRALVKFPGPVTAEQLAALSATAQIYTYLPHDTFVVRPRAGLAAARATGASWTGAYLPEYKISPAVDALAQQAQLASAETRTVMVTAFPDADLAAVTAAATGLAGVTVVGSDRGARFSRVRLRVAGASLSDATAALAALADVFWIDVEGRRELLNDTTVWVAQSGLNAGMTTPIFDHGIHGEGQVVGYIDTGIDADSCYFRDATRGLPAMNVCNAGTTVDPGQRKVLAADFLDPSECAGGIAANEWDTQNHGSHVAGTIAGDNLASPILHDPGDGMAPGAKLIVQDAGFLTDDCGDLPGIGCPVVDLKPFFAQAYAQGARIHTNSWGDNENAFVQNNYSAACQDVDEFMFSHPDFLILFAAGNSGPRGASVGSPSTNKNGLSVGATQRGTLADSMARFSSCGPAADGRFKPDLTMPGQNIVSARNDRNIASNNCNEITMSGTSMASPGAAGMAALVRQYYTDGYYPSGAPVAGHGFAPSAALVKATLLNSTQQMAGSGAGPLPDACQGWGRVLLENALYFTGQARRLVATDDPGFPQGGAGQQRTFTVQVEAGESLRATLGWTDFPSTPAASVNLENDLDLEVTGPSGTFLGNVFAGGQSATGGSADRINNVEQVLLAAPAPGIYTITVRAFNVPSSAQPFALVISGGINRAPDTVTATAVSDTQISVSWTSVPGAVKYFVFQSTAGGPFNFIGTVLEPSTSLVSTGLAPNTTYAYQIVTVDAGGAESAPSDPVSATTLAVDPNIPSHITATAVSSSEIDLSWSTVTSAAKYFVFESQAGGPFNFRATVLAPGTTFQATGLTAGTMYCYQLASGLTDGETTALSAPVCATTAAAVQPPGGVLVTAVSDTRILVQWQPSSSAVKYFVYQAVGGDTAFTPIGAAVGGDTAFLAVNLMPTTAYCYRVTGVDASGTESVPSATVCETTLAPGLGAIEGFWKLDETGGTSAIDSSGFGRNGTITDATYSLQDRPNLANDRSALSFSSSPDSAVFVPPAAGLDLVSASFTVSFWTKLPAAGSVTFVGSSAGDCIHPAWEIAQNASGLRVFDAHGPHAIATSIPVGAWTHVAVVFSPTSPNLTVYVGGAPVGTVASTQFGLAHDPFYIGHVAGCPGGAVMMDSVQVLSRAMSAAEVAAIGVAR
ncbi:MAG TPA: S8 family serine peptidase [Kofleriaceae bacterium]|nr:S8 family serine peptidase [Kofleriaceae bacterium]